MVDPQSASLLPELQDVWIEKGMITSVKVHQDNIGITDDVPDSVVVNLGGKYLCPYVSVHFSLPPIRTILIVSVGDLLIAMSMSLPSLGRKPWLNWWTRQLNLFISGPPTSYVVSVQEILMRRFHVYFTTVEMLFRGFTTVRDTGLRLLHVIRYSGMLTLLSRRRGL